MDVHWTYWGIISLCMEVKLLCWSAVCQLYLNKTEIGRKTIFIISKLLFAYPLILQKKERGKKKESKSDPTLDNGACQHLSVEHIIFSFWHAYGKR